MTGHLLHVGFGKAGSTYLRRWFEGHPQLTYGEGLIAGYRDVYEIAREAAAPPARILFRVTSSESFTAPHRDSGRRVYRLEDPLHPAVGQEQACSMLASLFPNAHVLIVTRGFRSMILSSYSQYVRSGADVSFEEFLDSPMLEHAWDYDRVLTLYQRAFGEEKVVAIPYELLRDDADRFVRTIEDRLGLAHHPAPPDRLNAALAPTELRWYPRLTRLVRALPIGPRLRRRVLHAIFAKRFGLAIAVLQRLQPAAPVTADSIPEALLALCRGKALKLRDNPLYRAYARDYYQS